MGAMRVRVGEVEVTFVAPALSPDAAELEREHDRERTARERDLDLLWSAS